MLKDLSVSGEGLVVKETVRMLGQVSGIVNVESCESFSPGCAFLVCYLM